MRRVMDEVSKGISRNGLLAYGAASVLLLGISFGLSVSIAYAGQSRLGDACSASADCVQGSGCNPGTGLCQSTGFYFNVPCNPNVANVCGKQDSCVESSDGSGSYVCGGQGPTVTVTASPLPKSGDPGGTGANSTSNASNAAKGSGGGVTFAQFVGNGTSGIIGVLSLFVIPTIFALVFSIFLFGVLKYYFFKSGSEEGRKQARQFILWGILGMVLMLSLWGVVALLLSTFGLSAGG